MVMELAVVAYWRVCQDSRRARGLATVTRFDTCFSSDTLTAHSQATSELVVHHRACEALQRHNISWSGPSCWGRGPRCRRIGQPSSSDHVSNTALYHAKTHHVGKLIAMRRPVYHKNWAVAGSCA